MNISSMTFGVIASGIRLQAGALVLFLLQAFAFCGSELQAGSPLPDVMVPAAFVPNEGQWQQDVQMQAQAPGTDLWLCGDRIVIDMYGSPNPASGTDNQPQAAPFLADRIRSSDHSMRRGAVVTLRFIGADSRCEGWGSVPGRRHYIRSSRHVGNVAQYERAVMRDLYPGIDAVVKFQNGQPRYDLHVAPGSDPSLIRIAITGCRNVRLDNDAALIMETGQDEWRQDNLFAYQMFGEDTVEVACAFRLSYVDTHPTVDFELAAYDKSRELIIDPLVSSTFIGGTANDEFHAIAVDENDNIIAVGQSTSADFPAQDGAYQREQNQDVDAVIAILSPDASVVKSATYFGGEERDVALDLALGPEGDIIICGQTESQLDFPISEGVVGQKFYGGRDAFVARLNADASELIYASYLGGDLHEAATAVSVGEDGRVYLAGWTNSGDFPLEEAFQANLNRSEDKSDEFDAFVMALTPNLRELRYATFLGGMNNDRATALTLGDDEDVYVTGLTRSDDFVTEGGGVKYLDGDDIFLSRFSFSGQLISSTMMGGEGDEIAMDIALVDNGRVVLAGATNSKDFPVSDEAPYPLLAEGDVDAFVALMSANGGTVEFASYIGGETVDTAYALSWDREQNVFICGSTYSKNFPLINAGCTGAVDSSDVFLASLRLEEQPRFTYSDVFGGSSFDAGHDLALNSQGLIVLAGYTESVDLPIRGKAAQARFKKAEDELPTREAFVGLFTPEAPRGLAVGSSLGMGVVMIGEERVKNLRISNQSRETINFEISDILQDYDYFELLSASTGTLAPCASITLRLRFKPQEEGLFEAELKIVSDEPWDLVVRLSGTGERPPPFARLSIPAELTARVGERFLLPLIIEEYNESLTVADVASLRFRLSFNASMCTAADPALRGPVEDGLQRMTVNSAFDVAGLTGGAQTLIAIPMIAGLGDAETTPLGLDDFAWLDGEGNVIEADIELQSGQFRTSDIWDYDESLRFVNPNGVPLTLQITPSSLSEGEAEIIVSYPAGDVALEIFDMAGSLVLDLSERIDRQAGESSTSLGADELPSGIYFCRLRSGTFSLVRTVRFE